MDTPRWVEYGRWDEAHRATLARLIAIENDLHDLRGAEQVHRLLDERISVLESAGKTEQHDQAVRRDRRWAVALTVAAGIVCPLVVTTIIAWLHLRALH
jgi:hypothetical protein